MTTVRPHSGLNLVWQSITPSVTSVIVSLFAGIITVLFGILVVAGQQGSTIGIQSGQVSFMNGFSRMLSRSSWRDILSIVLWTVIVSLACVALEFLFGSYAKFQDAAKEHISSGQHAGIVELVWLLKRMLWRVIIGLIAIVGATLLVQLTTWVSAAEKSSVSVTSFAQNAHSMTIACLIWALVYYACIVFLRLYTFRPNML